MFQFVSKLYFLQNLLALIIGRLIPPFLVHNLGKYFALKKAFYITSLENLEGDYVEFGVFTGSSFVSSIYNYKFSKVDGGENIPCGFYGFDSFEGFGEISEIDSHPFYTNLNFKTNYDSVLKRVTKTSSKFGVSAKLIKGFFSDTCDNKKPSDYGINKIRVCLIDCDTYDGARSAFEFISKDLQQGTILLLDDYFSYRGSEDRGLKLAFEEWKKISSFNVRKVSDYGMGGIVYILC